jgi:tight adherence protein B
MNTLIMAVLIAVSVFSFVVIGAVLLKKPHPVTADGTLDVPAETKPDPKTEKQAALALRLKRAGIEVDPKLYQKRVVMYAVALGIVGLAMGGFGLGGILFGGLLAFGTIKGGDFYINFRHGKRLAEFVDQFVDALGVMSNGAKSGQTVIQSMETVANDFNDPLKGEIDEVLNELRLGVPLDVALNNWVLRMPCEDLEIAVTALVVQRQTGGNVTEILDTLSDTIRQRNKLHKQISALTAQGRMSGWVMAMLPIGMFLAMYLIAPARMSLLITHPIGILFTTFGLFMIGLGGYFIKKIVTIEV